ncbi:hypothetical protein [Streptomyces hirsutus]|uniref:hypothetical protein n=1 Tax=Streptomyces hirsutus TaxID=35620 RepID=UPI0036657E64
MTDVLAFLGLVISLTALLCGHQAQPFPPLRWWRAARASHRRSQTRIGVTE